MNEWQKTNGYNSNEHLVAQLQTMANLYSGTGSEIIRVLGAKWGSISGDITAQQDLMNILKALKKQIEDITIDVGNVFDYKGTVPSYADLPTTAKSGDVYNVADTGANYVYTGTEWDKLSETIDLSGYVSKDDLSTALASYYLKSEVENLITSLNDIIQAKLDEKADTSYVVDLNNAVVDGLNAEIESRKSADTSLINALNTEITDRTASEAALQTNINKVASDLQKHIDEAETGYVTNAQFNEEVSARQTADETLQANINEKANKADVYTKIESDEKYLQEHQDISGKLDKSEVFKNGVFETTNTKANGTVVKIWNESDGGGTQIIDGVSNVQAYTGVHEGSDGTNIYVQTYAVDKNTKIGTRINVNKDGAYLTSGKNTYTFTDEDAIITKKDLDTEIADRTTSETALQANIDKVAQDLQKHIDEAETGFVTNAQLNEEITARQTNDAILQANVDKVASDLEEHIADTDKNAATKKELQEESEIRQSADETLQSHIDLKANASEVYTKSDVYTKEETANLIETSTTNLFKYKGQVNTDAELPLENNKVGDTYNVVETEANYTWNGSAWDKLSETIDLTPYATKEEVNTETANRENADNKIISKLWNQTDLDKGYFQTVVTKANGTTAKIWNESDGGGTQIIDGVSNIQAYTGVHEGSDGTGIYVQSYAVDKNSKLGTRINVTPEGAFYTTGKNTYRYSATDEIATKGNLNGIVSDLNTAIETEVTNRKNADTVLQESINLKANISDVNVALENEKTLREHADEINVEALNALSDALADEVNNRKNADNTLDEVKADKTTVADLETSVMNEIGTVDAKFSNYYTKTESDATFIKEHQSLENYATKAELNTETAERETADKKIISKIWNQADLDKGYFQTKATNSDGSEAMIWNESDGGGSSYWNKSTGYRGYTGVADGAVKDIYVQLYAVEYGKSNKGARIQLTPTGAFYSKDVTKTDAEYEITVKKDVDALNAAIQAEIADIKTKVESIFHYKGSVATIQDLPNNAEIGDVYNIESDGHNVAWNGTDWDKLSETIDLTPYLTIETFNSLIANYYNKDEIDTKETALNNAINERALQTSLDEEISNREAKDAQIISKIWNQSDITKGYFQTKYSHTTGSYAQLWNESDGGGSQVFDKTDNVKSYVGTNLEEGKSADTDAINVQIYSVDDTTKTGVRINVNTDKAYYLQGSSKLNTEEREIAVRADVNTVQDNLTSLEDTVNDTLAHQNGNIQALLLQMNELQSKIQDLKSLDYEIVTLYEGSDTDLENLEKAFELSGSVVSNTKVNGESISFKETTIQSSCLDLQATSDITIKNSTMTGIVYKNSSNAIFKLHADGYISIRDCIITPETAYNGIEIGLTEGLAKSVIIDNVTFDGHLSNNAINIFGMDDYGVVTISNCYFKDVSNLLRISNRTNTSWTINLINCVCDKWETGQYAGMILLQDYTSGSREAADTNNIFNKLTINIQNCTKPDGTKITMPNDLSEICCTKDDNQIIYVWDAWRNFTEYDKNKYPTIHIQ